MSWKIEQDHDRYWYIDQISFKSLAWLGMTDCILQSSICRLEAFDLALAAAGGLCQRLRFWFVTQRWNKNIALNGLIHQPQRWLKNVEEYNRRQQFPCISELFRGRLQVTWICRQTFGIKKVIRMSNYWFSAEALLLYSWSYDAYFGQSWNLQAFRSQCTTAIVCFVLHSRLWRVMTMASHVTECHNLIWICIIYIVSSYVKSCHDSFCVLLQPFLWFCIFIFQYFSTFFLSD